MLQLKMLMHVDAISCHVDMKRKQMKTMTRIDKASIHKFSHIDKVRPDGVIHLRVLSATVTVQILTSTCCISLQPCRLCAAGLRIDQTRP